MPAIMDDPSASTIYRVSGAPPFPDPKQPVLPANIRPRQVTLRDRQTIATIVPFVSRDQVPSSLLLYLSNQFAKEIERGDTYPMIDPMPFDAFANYWLQNFAGIMLLGQINDPDEVVEGNDWSQECLGSFYIKPNYPGRSSHVCNAGFLVTDAARNRGVGRLMGEAYLDWAPKLGYTYSVFNLVYETNIASCRIWDALGFKRIGRIKGCGNLKSHPDRLVDAIMFGRDLGNDSNEESGQLSVSEVRFDKIRFYLKYGRYPSGSDRAEKSRLRSSATHYKLCKNGVLMLNGKEVISQPVRQMEIARRAHGESGHAGINKTTSVIAEKYHWCRIKETVLDVVRTCEQCKEPGKNTSAQIQKQCQKQFQDHIQTQNQNQSQSAPQLEASIPPRFHDVTDTHNVSGGTAGDFMASQGPSIREDHDMARAIISNPNSVHQQLASHLETGHSPFTHYSDIPSLLNPPFQPPRDHDLHTATHHLMHDRTHDASAAATLASLPDAGIYHPIDPQIISRTVNSHSHSHHHPQCPTDPFGSFSPRFPFSPHHHHHPEAIHPSNRVPHPPVSGQGLEYSAHVSHHALSSHDADTDTFQALLNDEDADADAGLEEHLNAAHGHHIEHMDEDHVNLDQRLEQHDLEQDDAVDRDMEMLIEHHDSNAASPDMDVSSTAASSSSSIRDDIDLEEIQDDLAALHKIETGNNHSRDRDAGTHTRHTTPDGPAARRSDIYNVVFERP